MNKIAIATNLQNAICGLELSPMEVECLTVIWISHYPFLLEDLGLEIQAHTSLQNIVAEIEKLKTILENIQNNENPADLLKAVVAPTQDSNVVVTTENAEEKKNDASSSSEEEKADGDVIEKDTPPSEVTGNVPEPPRPGYSKYGNKLGRRPKNKNKDEESPVSIVKGNKGKRRKRQSRQKPGKEEPLPKVADEPEETVAVVSPEPSKEDQPTDTPSPEEVKDPTFSDKDESVVATSDIQSVETDEAIIQRLKVGKEYKYELLYMVNDRYVRTFYRLCEDAGVKPIGVIIPYTQQNDSYEIVVYYSDEHAVIPLNIAKKYAKNKLPAYKGRSWRVKNSTDDAHIWKILPEINPILKKMGGDELKGDYMDGRGQIYDASTKVNLKIRYVCNIPLTDELEE